MEFSSLKEQRRQAHDAAEARAAAAAASEGADDISPPTPSSSRTKTSASSSTRGADDSRSSPNGPDPSAATAAAETPFGKAMADPDAARPDAFHSQPLQDGSLPQPDDADPSDAPEIAATEVIEPEEPPMRPHNLLTATEILQAPPGSVSPFTPAPILRLNAIRISGAGKVLRPGFLASLCRPYLDPALSTQNADASVLSTLYYGSRTSHVLPGQPTTLASILTLTSSLAGDLDKLDVFRNIEASLAPSVFPGASEEDVDVILACGRPKGRVFLKSSTDVGNGEGSASVQGRIRNVFGGAETLQGSATFGTRTRQAFNVEFGAPLPGNPDFSYRLAAFSHDRDLSAFASVSEAIRGVRASLNTSSTTEPRGVIDPLEDEAPAATSSQHEFAYEASLRELARIRPHASIAVRKMAAAPSVKSALSWTWLRDSRDSVVLPSRGSRLRTLVEYAGLGGDANHVKAEFEASTGRHFSPLSWLFPSTRAASAAQVPTLASTDATMEDEVEVASAVAWGMHPVYSTLTLRTGVVHALGTSAAHLSDRFQLGGPTSVRMFRHASLGPKHHSDSLGGDAFWSLGLSLFSPIPKRPHWPLMLHAFANAGQLAQLPNAPIKNSAEAWKQLAQPSSSAGVGIVYTQGQLRVELNAGVPLTARRADGTNKGLQLGIGIDFL